MLIAGVLIYFASIAVGKFIKVTINSRNPLANKKAELIVLRYLKKPWWFIHIIKTAVKLSINAKYDGHNLINEPKSISFVEKFAKSGTLISRMSKVNAIAKTPSLKASTLVVSFSITFFFQIYEKFVTEEPSKNNVS